MRVGSDSTISIFNSSGSTDVLIDVEGSVGTDAAAANGQTTTAAPVRLLDTRTTTGGHKAALANSKSLTLQVTGNGEIPATGVSAVYANVTAVPGGNVSGYLTVYPSGTAAPVISAINFMPGVITANLALLPVSVRGAITITNHSTNANVLVDVVGWVSGGDVTADAGILATSPTRIQNMQDVLLTAMAGQSAPQAATTLVAPVYGSYTTTKYSSPPYLSPGGTVYQPGSEAVYWPQGCDWGTVQYLPFALVDAETAAFGVGTANSSAYEDLHAKGQLALQQAPGHADGHTYDSDSQYNYVGREEHVAQLAAQLYLTMFVRDHALSSFSNSSHWLAP